jgi:hypothetical protein
MGYVYLDQDMRVSVRVYRLAESRSGQTCEGQGCLYLSQDRGMSVCASSIYVRMGV